MLIDTFIASLKARSGNFLQDLVIVTSPYRTVRCTSLSLAEPIKSLGLATDGAGHLVGLRSSTFTASDTAMLDVMAEGNEMFQVQSLLFRVRVCTFDFLTNAAAYSEGHD